MSLLLSGKSRLKGDKCESLGEVPSLEFASPCSFVSFKTLLDYFLDVKGAGLTVTDLGDGDLCSDFLEAGALAETADDFRGPN